MSWLSNFFSNNQQSEPVEQTEQYEHEPWSEPIKTDLCACGQVKPAENPVCFICRLRNGSNSQIWPEMDAHA